MAKVKRACMTDAQSNLLRTLVQVGGVSVDEIRKNKKKYPGFQEFSRATLFRHAKKSLSGEQVADRRHENKGRPRLLKAGDQRLVKRQIAVTRDLNGTFFSTELQENSGLTAVVSNSTFRRYLKRMGYGYRCSRKKGRLLKADLKIRRKFARKLKSKAWSVRFYRHILSMYIDVTGFEYKTNPADHARSPRAKEWRLTSEGLKHDCTAKGCVEGKTQIRFMVGISYGCGIVLCQPVAGKWNGASMANMVNRHFERSLELGVWGETKHLGVRPWILTDGCPVQNSAIARKALERLGAKYFCIPSRSPDLNPIENLFNLVKRQLRADAQRLRITKESMEEFALRVKNTLLNFPSATIDKLIDSMPKRVDMVIKSQGQRIRY